MRKCEKKDKKLKAKTELQTLDKVALVSFGIIWAGLAHLVLFGLFYII